MICVFMKGATKEVISTLSSASWIKPGDSDWPFTVYKTEAAFLKRWKALEKAKFKLVRTESSPPKRKPQKYTVKLKSTQPLLKAFGAWLKPQLYGSVGYFELISAKIPTRITKDAALAKNGQAFISLPDGSLVVQHDEKIVFLDSEGGKAKALAPDLHGFLTKLAAGRTGVGDLDDKDATARKALKAWLTTQTKA